MGDFKVTIPEAVNNVQPFVQAMDDAQRECQDAVRYVHTMHESLTHDRQELAAAVAGLHQDAQQVEEVLPPQIAGATANFGRVKTVVEHVVEEWEQVFHEEEQALTSASQLLTGLAESVKEIADDTDKTTHAVLEWVDTASKHLEDAVTAVEQLMHDVTEAVAAWKKAAEEEVAHVVEYMAKDIHAAVNTKDEDFKHKLEQLHDFLDHAFSDLDAHDKLIEDYAEKHWSHMLEEQIKSAHEVAQTLADALTSLAQAVENDDSELQVAGQMVAERQQQAAEAATSMEQALGALREHWESFGINC